MVLVPLQGFMFCENARRLLAEAIEEGDEHSNLSFAFKRARFATLEHLHPMVVVSQDDRTPLMTLYKTLLPDTAREEPPAPWHLALLSPSYSMPAVKEEHVLLASNRKTFHFGKMADRAALRSESLEFTQISLLRNNFKESEVYRSLPPDPKREKRGDNQGFLEVAVANATIKAKWGAAMQPFHALIGHEDNFDRRTFVPGLTFRAAGPASLDQKRHSFNNTALHAMNRLIGAPIFVSPFDLIFGWSFWSKT